MEALIRIFWTNQVEFSATYVDKKSKGGRDSGTFFSRGAMKNLKLGKYPHSRADHFHVAYIFHILHPKAQNCEKNVFLAILAWFWRIFAISDAFRSMSTIVSFLNGSAVFFRTYRAHNICTEMQDVK